MHIKMNIYNHTALEVFLYNIPERILRAIQIKEPATLEQALRFALEQAHFDEHYYKNRKVQSNPFKKPIKQRNVNQPGTRDHYVPNTSFQNSNARNNFPNSNRGYYHNYRPFQGPQNQSSHVQNPRPNQATNRPAFVPRNKPFNQPRPNSNPHNNNVNFHRTISNNHFEEQPSTSSTGGQNFQIRASNERQSP
jgi:hypothetical protein